MTRTIASGVIIDARRRAGLTQGALARRAGVARPLISQYEGGKKDPSLTTLSRLLAACGMDLCVRAEPLDEAERAQYLRDSEVGHEQARRNAERARRELVSIRRPAREELSRLLG